MSVFEKTRQNFEDLFTLANLFGLQRQDIDLALLDMAQTAKANNSPFASEDAQLFMAACLIRSQHKAHSPEPANHIASAFQNPLRAASDAQSGYWPLAKALMAQVSLKQVITLPAAQLQKHRATLRHLLRENIFAGDIKTFLSTTPMPAALYDWHAERQQAIFSKLMKNKMFFGAVSRVLAYRGQVKPYARFEADLTLIHKIAAYALNNIRPGIVFDNCAAGRISGTANKAIIRHTDMEEKGWKHNFYNAVCLRDAHGTRLSGETVLDKLLHELLHSKEEGLIERVMGKTNDLMHENQKRYFRQGNLDGWTLKESAVLLSLNSSLLGAYIGYTENETLHYSQFRERHARWFAAQTTKMLKLGVTRYAPLHHIVQNPAQGMAILLAYVHDFLKNAPEKLAKINPLMPSVRDICQVSMGLGAMAEHVLAIDANVSDAPKQLQNSLVALQTHAEYLLNPPSYVVVVSDNRREWALRELRDFAKSSQALLADLQTVQAGQTVKYSGLQRMPTTLGELPVSEFETLIRKQTSRAAQRKHKLTA